VSRIGDAFAKQKALIAYVTAGDPDLAHSREVVLACARAGADIIELGIPFSDPNADGPAIQAAMQRALAARTSLRSVLDLCAEVRRESDVPIVLFGYYNPIFVHGCARFAADAKVVGADGVLVVDLPPEESAELVEPLRTQGLALVPMVAPTSTDARIDRAARVASEFIYYVSMTGVTGRELSDVDDVRARVEALRKRVSLPVAVGFGVTTPEDVRRVGAFADGVVVGSAIVRVAQKGGAEAAGTFVRALKAALS
jgi:tryptophan synthase alpha chain